MTSPEELPSVIKSISQKYITVFSPNAKEAAAFLGEEEPMEDTKIIETGLQFLIHFPDEPSASDNDTPEHRSKLNAKFYSKAVVLRCGVKGCLVLSKSEFPCSTRETKTVIPFCPPGASDAICSTPEPVEITFYSSWFPAYHNNRRSPDFKVEDPTGGGNTFLGGFAAGLVSPFLAYNFTANLNGSLASFSSLPSFSSFSSASSHHSGEGGRKKSNSEFKLNFGKAAVFGNIAAGLAIEQVGVPKLSQDIKTGDELWNGETIDSRIRKYLKRNNLWY